MSRELVAGVSASLGECWADCTMDVGEYNWTLFLKDWTQRHWTYPLVVLFCMRIQKAGWHERELGGCFSSLSLVAVPFPEAFASGTSQAAFVMPYWMAACVEHLLLLDLGVME